MSSEPCKVCGAPAGAPMEEHWLRSWRNSSNALRVVKTIIALIPGMVFELFKWANFILHLAEDGDE